MPRKEKSRSTAKRRKWSSKSFSRKVRHGGATEPILPAAKIHHSLTQAQPKAKVKPEVSLFLSAAVEYLMAEILEKAGNCAVSRRCKSIEIKDVVKAIQADKELNELLGDMIKEANRKQGERVSVEYPAKKMRQGGKRTGTSREHRESPPRKKPRLVGLAIKRRDPKSQSKRKKMTSKSPVKNVRPVEKRTTPSKQHRKSSKRIKLAFKSPGKKVRGSSAPQPIFPAEKIHYLLTKEKPKAEIKPEVSLFLSVAEEYLMAEILEKAKIHATSRQSKSIEIDDVIEAIRADKELDELLGDIIKEEPGAPK